MDVLNNRLRRLTRNLLTFREFMEQAVEQIAELNVKIVDEEKKLSGSKKDVNALTANPTSKERINLKEARCRTQFKLVRIRGHIHSVKRSIERVHEQKKMMEYESAFEAGPWC